MAAIDERGLRVQLKEENYSNVYFFYGEEDYLKEFYINKLKKKIVDPAFEDFNYHEYEGKDISLDDILQDAQTFPMMSAYNFLLVRDYPLDRSAEDIKLIKEFLKDVPETTVMIFVFNTIEIDVKRNSKHKSLAAAFSKAGTSVNFEKRTEADLAKLVISNAKKYGAVVDSSVARYLISVSGSDINTLMNETKKLAMCAQGSEITKQLVDELATKSLQARVYDLSKAIVKGNADLSHSILDTLFSMKEEPIVVLAVIGGCYVDMYRVKCAKIAGEPCEDVGTYYPYKGREFALRNALRDSSKISVDSLRRSLDILTDADFQMKSSSIDKKILLEKTVASLLLEASETIR